MCYSAAVKAEFASFQRLFPSTRLKIKEFFDLYIRRKRKPKPMLRVPRVVDAQFSQPQTDEERQIRGLIEEFNAEQVVVTEQELFAQRKRLADAERSLQSKETKKALNDQRVAGNKIADALAKLERMRRTELRESDARMFPGWWVPVLMMEDGVPVVRPMRYQCRPAGKPAFYDTKYPGTYNARRDNLRGFWKEQFGSTHGVLIVTSFFENVARHAAEHRELRPGEAPENLVLRFATEPPADMLIACLVSYWTPPPGSDEEPFWSFAAVTDEPLPEVAAAGHDRTIIALKPENVEAWLTPAGRSFDELDGLLEDKARPYYQHELAKAA